MLLERIEYKKIIDHINKNKTTTNKIHTFDKDSEYIYIDANEQWTSIFNELKKEVNIILRNNFWDYLNYNKNKNNNNINYDFNNIFNKDEITYIDEFNKDKWRIKQLDNNTLYQYKINNINTPKKNRDEIYEDYINNEINEDTTITCNCKCNCNCNCTATATATDISQSLKNFSLINYDINSDNKPLYNYIEYKWKSNNLPEKNVKKYYILDYSSDINAEKISFEEPLNYINAKKEITKHINNNTKHKKLIYKSRFDQFTEIEKEFVKNTLFDIYNNNPYYELLEYNDKSNYILNPNNNTINKTNNNTINKILKDIQDPHKKTWMYNIEGMENINTIKTIHDIEHPYYGAYYNNESKDTNKERARCLSSNANGNIGECNRKGIYKNGKICKFIPSLWGFKGKKYLYTYQLFRNYNPHKMCKGKIQISSIYLIVIITMIVVKTL